MFAIFKLPGPLEGEEMCLSRELNNLTSSVLYQWPSQHLIHVHRLVEVDTVCRANTPLCLNNSSSLSASDNTFPHSCRSHLLHVSPAI